MHPRDAQTNELAQLDAAEIARRLQRLTELERLMSERSDELAWANERLVAELYERNEAEAEVSALASIDGVSGLPNRSAFETRLQTVLIEASAREQPVAVMLLGLDRLVQIRDTLGYQMGDQVVRALAERLRQAVRGSDLVARIGDDTFAVALTQLRIKEDVAVVARKLHQALEPPFKVGEQVGEQSFRLVPALGIALYPADGATPDQLLARADNAMHRARDPRTGLLQFFHPEMAEQMALQLALEDELRTAVKHNQFVNHYQPRFNLKTGVCVGAETLLRWTHPARGTLFPAAFLELAVSTGLIVPIGAQVLRQACADAVRWGGEGIVSVNFSAREFQGSALLETVQEALSRSGLPPQRLQLEVTETDLRAMAGDEPSHSGARPIKALEALRAMGVQVALDDFGAGAASLSTLVDYEVDSLKIDPQFVSLLPNDKRAVTLVATIIHLAKRLRIQVVAEGIESETQREFLSRMGCAQGQGYALARPDTSERVAAIVAAAPRARRMHKVRATYS